MRIPITAGEAESLVSSGPDLVLSLAGPEVIEPLLQELFELCTGATLQQHVPVGARHLGVGLLRGDLLAVQAR